MTPDQAAETLGALTAAWPHADLPDNTVRLWLGFLTELEQPDAMAAAKRLVRSENFFPSIARFLTETEAQAHARRNRDASYRGLPSHRIQPSAPPARLLAATRQLLAEQKSKRHDHKGPAPCPVCGGRKPDIITSKERA